MNHLEKHISHFESSLPPWLEMVQKGLVIVIFLLATYLINRILNRLLKKFLTRHPGLAASSPLLTILTHLIVWSLGGMVLLETLGIPITPLLASLGVGSLAAGLALQDTLGNLFGGFYLMLDHPLTVGDPVRLESGEEGIVERIGWRATHIRLPQENILIIPNRSLVTSRFINHNLPEKAMNLIVEFTASPATDLAKLEEEILKAAATVQAHSTSVIKNIPPIFTCVGFVDLGVRCSITLRVASFAHLATIRHALIKQLQSNLKSAGIYLPAIGSVTTPLN